MPKALDSKLEPSSVAKTQNTTQEKKLKLTWTFEKVVSQKTFDNHVQEQNDLVFWGYSVISLDCDLADCSDDFHLQAKVEEI